MKSHVSPPQKKVKVIYFVQLNMKCILNECENQHYLHLISVKTDHSRRVEEKRSYINNFEN